MYQRRQAINRRVWRACSSCHHDLLPQRGVAVLVLGSVSAVGALELTCLATYRRHQACTGSRCRVGNSCLHNLGPERCVTVLVHGNRSDFSFLICHADCGRSCRAKKTSLAFDARGVSYLFHLHRSEESCRACRVRVTLRVLSSSPLFFPRPSCARCIEVTLVSFVYRAQCLLVVCRFREST